MKLDTHDELLLNNMNAYFYFLKNSDPTGIINYMQNAILNMLSSSDIPTINLFINDLLEAMQTHFTSNGLDDDYLGMAYTHKAAHDILLLKKSVTGI